MSTTTKKPAATKAAATKKAATPAPKATQADITAAADANLAKMKASEVEAIAAMNKLERVNAAKIEVEAKKAAQRAGKKVPPTPVLDFLNSTEYRQRQANGTTSTRKGSGGTRTKRIATGSHVLYKNGKQLARQSLSFAAWSMGRVGIDGLRVMLDGAKVPADAEEHAWSITDKDGNVLENVLKGDAPAFVKTAPAKRAATTKATAAKKAPAKKGAAKKAPATPKAIGKQAAAQKAVSTRRAAKRAS